ncbi:hypothetical protein SD71_10660 [Cohnella kolymensis]|uniref:Uncharacterized protein n=1 Tax=Cohnella kolymensis TaxID=1590652 RepID=A0ABR5A468_9BACL|nr:hypothetical protein SD71_10660 [Cohnella kolymensis]
MNESTETFLSKNFPILVNQSYGMGDITEDMRNTLLNLEPSDLGELDDAYAQLFTPFKTSSIIKSSREWKRQRLS